MDKIPHIENCFDRRELRVDPSTSLRLRSGSKDAQGRRSVKVGLSQDCVLNTTWVDLVYFQLSTITSLASEWRLC
jgi:hypothetical protein